MESVAERAGAFRVEFSAERNQYVVERGEMCVVPTCTPLVDPVGMVRARQVARALNRVYATEEAK